MTIAVLIPTSSEMEPFTSALETLGLHGASTDVGRISCLSYCDRQLLVARGGLGKVNFAVTTLHIIERSPPINGLICLGTCGALAPDLAIGT